MGEERKHKHLTVHRFGVGPLLVALTLTPRAQAQAQEQEPELYKDPLIALYLSATLPGLGQFYTDDKKRGLLFFTSIVGAFGSAYAFYRPADLELADYDKTRFGGNADGLISTTEAKNWEDDKFQDDAFDQFSTGRKVGVITSVAAGLGLYIWNVIDAPKRAHDRNRQVVQRRVGVELLTGPDRVGFAVKVNF